MKKLLTLLMLNVMPCTNAMLFDPANNKSSSGVIVPYIANGNTYIFLRRLKQKEFPNVVQYGPLFEWDGKNCQNPTLVQGIPTEQDQRLKAILRSIVRRYEYQDPKSSHTFTLFTTMNADDDQYAKSIPLCNYDGAIVCKKLTDFHKNTDRFYINPDTNELESMPLPFHQTFQRTFFNTEN